MADIIWDSELGPSWPDDWEHTTVHAQFVAVTGDGADTDRLPDIAPSGNGEVIFTPSLRTVRYVGADGPYVVSLKQYRAVVDNEGYLCTPDTFGQPGERGIVLPSTDSPVIEPRGEDDNAFTWRVDFDIPAVTIRSDHIAVPVDGPHDLVDLLSPERAAGVVHIIDRVSARDAIQAAQEAVEARDLVLPARDETLVARDETLAHGLTVDTSVGTRVFVGDTMIHGDTGLRNILDMAENPDSITFAVNEPPTIQRQGNLVTLEMSVTGPGTFARIFVLPTGFRPTRNLQLGVDNETRRAFFAFGAGGMYLYSQNNVSMPNTTRLSFRWATANRWPTTLPGLPA